MQNVVGPTPVAMATKFWQIWAIFRQNRPWVVLYARLTRYVWAYQRRRPAGPNFVAKATTSAIGAESNRLPACLFISCLSWLVAGSTCTCQHATVSLCFIVFHVNMQLLTVMTYHFCHISLMNEYANMQSITWAPAGVVKGGHLKIGKYAMLCTNKLSWRHGVTLTTVN